VVATTQKSKRFLITELNKNKNNINDTRLVMIYGSVVCGWNTKYKTEKKAFGGPY
jgi:hypothetical protein